MTPPSDYSFRQYLAAKRSLDDRSLNRPVWDKLMQTIGGEPQRVLEIGCGIGTMIDRLREWELPIASLTAVDADPDLIAEAAGRLPAGTNDSPAFEVEAIDLFELAARERGGRRWDLVIAHAILDVVDPGAVSAMMSLARPDGLLYWTLTFNEGTIFQPEIEPELDERIVRLYHREMYGSGPGDSRAGRRLFHRLRSAGAEVLEMGSSDWVIFPCQDGYRVGEAYVAHFIVNRIWEVLHGHPAIPERDLRAWIHRRHAQIEAAELVYMAHQLDLLARVPGRPDPDWRRR